MKRGRKGFPKGKETAGFVPLGLPLRARAGRVPRREFCGCPKWRTLPPARSRGIHKGAAAPLVGGAGSIDACQRLFAGAQRASGVGGTRPAPACPRRGKRERGRSTSLLPQAKSAIVPPSLSGSGQPGCARPIGFRSGSAPASNAARCPTWHSRFSAPDTTTSTRPPRSETSLAS